ncbi:MAG: DUF1648 domain-containing protein [Candidatus Eisenbacteria bacterium]|uniref:DUF1648 domain-containing protein n=1 Tax=Eiseniibacteriota bacterium TaxID=2212470 RepID=A0A538U122_UNCEI|nr:MAG: DUF1648 domain-containing protein [Candidatus Eisenbacteria bacterium]
MWLLIAAMFALAAWTWSAAPDRLPVHWGITGQADRWGGKFEGLLLMPLVAMGLYLLTAFLPRIDPGRANYASFTGAYRTIRLVILLVLAAIYVSTVLKARGVTIDMAVVVPLGVGAMFVLLGNVLGKLRPNWFVGIRTPWTLSSKESWTRTHRAGGWVFITIGFLLMGVALFRTQRFVEWTVGAAAAAVVGLAVYSYFVWKRDPDKTPPAGTLPAG